MTRRQALLALGGVASVVVGVPVGWSVVASLRFPSEHTPEGAYIRITLAIGQAKVRDSFPYLETAAQHAVYGILDLRKRSLAYVRDSFVEPEKSRWIAAWQDDGDAVDPPDLWAKLAARNGWDTQMRRDLSGIARVETAGERATVETMHGTRYAFRRGDDGIWGLTQFTAELVALRDRAKQEFTLTERAAQDYERAKPAP